MAENIDIVLLKIAMKKCGMNALPEAINEVEVARCSGDMICYICGNSYASHPIDPRILDKNGEGFLQIICDGRRVKL